MKTPTNSVHYNTFEFIVDVYQKSMQKLNISSYCMFSLTFHFCFKKLCSEENQGTHVSLLNVKYGKNLHNLAIEEKQGGKEIKANKCKILVMIQVWFGSGL